MTCDKPPGNSVLWGQRKWAHRKCSHTGPRFACTASQAAPPEDWGLSAPTKPHPGLHHGSEIETRRQAEKKKKRVAKKTENGLERNRFKETSYNKSLQMHTLVANCCLCLRINCKQVWQDYSLSESRSLVVTSTALRSVSVFPWHECVAKSNTLFWAAISSWSKFKGLTNQWLKKKKKSQGLTLIVIHTVIWALLSTSELSLISLLAQTISTGWLKSSSRHDVYYVPLTNST